MDMLVTASWLAAHLHERDIVVLDASKHLPAAQRDAPGEYRHAHIAGARFLDLASLADPDAPAPNAVPTPDQFAARMSALGVEREQRIVLYDDSDLRSAARAWAVFRLMGIAQVAVLDGGLEAWRAGGYPIEEGESENVASSFPVPIPDYAALRSKAAVFANCTTRAEQLIDARDAGRFTGEVHDTVHDLPGGHIPGARNLFYRDLLREDGRFKPRGDLQAAFDETGIDLARPVVTSCGSGMTASVVLFALHLAGAEKTALYDGSWSEWGVDPATPKELGPAR